MTLPHSLRVNSEVYLPRRRGQVNMRKCFDQETVEARVGLDWRKQLDTRVEELFGVRRQARARRRFGCNVREVNPKRRGLPPGVWRLCEIQKRTRKLARIERPLLGLEMLLIKILT